MNKVSGSCDYSGYWSSDSNSCSLNNTFSVGIFKWLSKKTGHGLKKSKVLFRVKGYVSNPSLVYKTAIKICQEMANGIFPKTKLMWVE